MPKRLNDSRSAAIVFALLVLATLAAFAYAQRVKRDPLVLDRVSFSGAPRHKGQPVVHAFTPNRDCRLQVIKPGGRVVYTLARDEFLKRYTFHTYFWDGRQRGGGTAHPGRYKLRVRFDDRTLVTPGVIRLHPAPKGGKGKC